MKFRPSFSCLFRLSNAVPNERPNTRISRLIFSSLLDDNQDLVRGHQIRNHLWLNFRDRNRRLVIAKGIVDEILQREMKGEGSPVDLLFEIQWRRAARHPLKFKKFYKCHLTKF